ncbi:substrate-binding and VWA domain-containing protein [Actinokineospora enzanensis]|uniref:substrate-binding and VWA domain-containing protein n=1 Tax=Actinokineospora enzanensis TaxID=155975 RepID=UPI0003632B8B|nr:substrate-binding and VWA domain-containing protein [Actinokineospora enzanensis]
MGRHSSLRRPRWGFAATGLLLIVLLALVVGGWFALDTLRDHTNTAGPPNAQACESTTLRVVVTPDIAPVVDAAAKRVGDGCARVDVTVKPAATAVDAMLVTDGSQLPDVWIPDSSLWLRRAQEKGVWPAEVSGTSLASSPIVLALAEETATRLGWPGKPVTWSQALLPEVATALPDPSRDPIGVAALIGIRASAAGTPDPSAATISTMRRISPLTVPQAADLFTSPQPLGAFPTSEQALIHSNDSGAAQHLVAAYQDVPTLDYPYTVLPQASPQVQPLSQRLLDALQSADTRTSLADNGFRASDGKILRDRSADARTSSDTVVPIPFPPNEDINQLLNQWAGVNLSARIQILLDVSGSMAEPVKGTGTDRMGVTLKAAELGIGMFRPTTKFGLWLFSTNLDGKKDYKELLPVLPVADQLKAGALDKLHGVKAIKGGATGLYDSVLAAYQSARTNWEPGRINLVVVMTDGKNEDKEGISRAQLLAELAKLQDPDRPLQLIGIGIGPDVDLGELQEITKPTGGQAFTTPDPTKIGDIFYKALSGLLCQPPSCAN